MNQAAIPYGLRDADLSAAEIKSTPVAADGLLLIDSDDGGSIKRVSPDSLGGGAENIVDTASGVEVIGGAMVTGAVQLTTAYVGVVFNGPVADTIAGTTARISGAAGDSNLYLNAPSTVRLRTNNGNRVSVSSTSVDILPAVFAGTATFSGRVTLGAGLLLAPITRAALLATTPIVTAGQWRVTDQNNEPAYPDGAAWRSLATNQVIA